MRALFFGLISCAAFALFVTSFASAVLTSQTTISTNSFTTASEFPTDVTPTPDGEDPTPPATELGSLVINEVSILGDSNAEWVEVFNKSNSPINLNGWFIEDGSGSDPLPNITIPAGSYGVIITSTSIINATPSGAVEVRLSGGSSPASIGSGLNNTGGDEVEIKNGTTSIDGINYGTSTTFFSPGVTIPASGNTISRIPNGIDTDSSGDWLTNTIPTMGGAN